MERGRRLTEILKQPQYTPLKVEEQVVVIFSGVRGYLDKISINDITKFEKYLLEKIRSEGKQILEFLKKEQSISDDLDSKLSSFVENVVKNFLEENNAKP